MMDNPYDAHSRSKQYRGEASQEAHVRRSATKNGSYGLLVRAQPLEMVERLCTRLSDEVWVADDALLLVADPTWAGAVNTVLVKKGLRASELRHVRTGE